ncbi:uncharacterized protein LOC101859528 [Aplysia californica]|uniref:Uncharacterized protein LOC101859528 n=1 Tax=Aplysia californica TaxID=6500 RepID=A0ABM0K8V6_APLCA|nr:uncharacterized protein LOC101859528 [Aplysia californica]
MTSPLTALALTLMVSLVMVEGLGSWKRRPWYPDDVQQMLPQYYWSTSHRRAYYPCAQTGLGCNDDKKCCSKHETCLTELKYNRRSNSCQDLRPERTGYKTLGMYSRTYVLRSIEDLSVAPSNHPQASMWQYPILAIPLQKHNVSK